MAAATNEARPTIKKNICFADTLDIATKSLTKDYTDVNFDEAEKLMLFGVEDWKTGKNNKKFAKAFENNTFKDIEIFGCEMGNDGAKALADGLKLAGGKIIESLELDNSPLTAEGARFIIESVNENDNIRKLNLQGSVKDPESLKAMAKELENNQHITHLDLKINDIKVEGAESLGKMFQMHPSLVELDLFYNEIGEQGAGYIADALRMDQCVLEVLNLSCNQIKDGGAVAIGEALQVNRTLKKLYLALNEIKDDGAKMLVDACNPAGKDTEAELNSVLEVLDMCANQIGTEGAKAIASCIIYAKGLQEIDFTGIEPGKQGWEYFVSAFQALDYTYTESKLQIKFSIVDIDDDMLEAVEAAIGDNDNVHYKRKETPEEKAARQEKEKNK